MAHPDAVHKSLSDARPPNVVALVLVVASIVPIWIAQRLETRAERR